MSTQKLMLVVFIDRLGVVYHKFVPNGRGIGCILYEQILERFHQALRRRRQHQWHNGWTLLQDGAPAHRAGSVVRYLRYHGVDTIQHPAYSPDLNPCDYWFFNRIKRIIRGHRFRDTNALMAAVNNAI